MASHDFTTRCNRSTVRRYQPSIARTLSWSRCVMGHRLALPDVMRGLRCHEHSRESGGSLRLRPPRRDHGHPLASEIIMFNERSSFGSYALTFALGALAGAAVALMFAPMTGKKMQRKVADVTEKVRDVVEDSVDNVQSVLRKVGRA